MANKYYDITLALAGICQAARLVQHLAHQGQCDPDDALICYKSILDLNPVSTLSVFGSQMRNLYCGLDTMLSVIDLSKRKSSDEEVMRYILSLVMLERRLSSDKAALDGLVARINGLQRQLEHFPLDSETLINAMAAIYLDVISPLGPRIQVTGSPEMLQLPLVQAKVRAILLAGMRAAVLWRQMGGGRLQLIIFRNRLVAQAKQIIAQC